MATFRGISAIGTAVLAMLTEAWARHPFESTILETKLVQSEQLAQRPTDFGVSLYVYRVAVNGTQRTLAPAEPRHLRPLPVEVSFIVTPWATSAQRQLELLGWCMRAMGDQPVLSAADLNHAVPGVFAPDEIVEVVPVQLPPDEYFRLWDALTFDYQLSVAYAARIVRLQSEIEVVEGPPVLERTFTAGALVAP
jgi:hypothetical protein